MINNNCGIRPKCELCGKSIVKFGISRKNGTFQRDWILRKYHKKCYKRIKEREANHIFFAYSLPVANE